MAQHKLGLIGAGQIGGTLAHLALIKNLGSVVLFDIAPGFAAGKALDLSQSAPLEGWRCKIMGTDCPEDLAGCDVIIVTAGFARKPGMSRDDLLNKNAGVIRDVAQMLRIHAPNAFVIVVTNPLDVMVWVMKQATGFAAHQVIGMAGILDTARFRTFLASALSVDGEEIQAMVLGGHGDLMVPLARYTTISGIPLSEWVARGALTEADLEAIITRTRNGGGEIVSLLKTGSAYYTPAHAAIQMAESILFDRKRVLPCAAWLDGAYGHHDAYASVPVILGKGGVESIVQLDLSDHEQAAFDASVLSVRKLIQSLAE